MLLLAHATAAQCLAKFTEGKLAILYPQITIRSGEVSEAGESTKERGVAMDLEFKVAQ
jgi:hypothetical protein